MSEYNHHCPELSPNNKVPNMTASGCAARVKRREGKCARCPSGIGYVAPVKKKITEKLWRNPNEKKKKRKQYHIRNEFCACGEKREPQKSHCEACRIKNIAASRAKFLLKDLLRRRVVLDKRIEEAKKVISG